MFQRRFIRTMNPYLNVGITTDLSLKQIMRINHRRKSSFAWRFEQSLLAHPFQAAIRPRRAGVIDLAHREIVSGSIINVQLRGNAGFLQGQIHEHAAFGRADDVRTTMHEKNWRCFNWDSHTRRKFVFVLELQVARVSRNGEIRAAKPR